MENKIPKPQIPKSQLVKLVLGISRALGGLGLGFGIFLSACVSPTATVTPSLAPVGITPTPTSVLANSTSVPTTPEPTTQMLRLWLPPQFAPDENTPGGQVLLAQLAAFEKTSGWQVEVRVKKTVGQGGLLDALHTALQVAPSTSPDVIALDSVMLANAESLQPLTPISQGDLVDFYPFALQSARIDNTLIALPFAADVLGFAYSTNPYPIAPQTWADLKPENGVAALPLNDPTSLVTLQQYLALGGELTDSTGQITLDKIILTQILTDYQTLQTVGVLPAESIDATSVEVSWITYRENRAAAAVTFFGSYLVDRHRVAATTIAPIPTRTGAKLTLARQWNYALVVTDPSRQAIALELMRWLTAPDNLGPWTLAAAVLPPRAQALNAWSEPGLAAVADSLLSIAQPEPSSTLLAKIGPAINTAVQSVLSGQATPEQAANTAAATVAGR